MIEVLDDSQPCITPERRLMMAVIIAAINDALGRSAVNDLPHEREYARRQAMAWLGGFGRDFQVVCLAAGLSPKAVSVAALGFIEKQNAQFATARRDYAACENAGVDLAFIAKRAKLHKKTVERALSGDSRCRTHTRETVFAALREIREAAFT